MVVIRLARHGAKKRPFYHVVAADKRSARGGRFVEKLGFFNPIAQGDAVRLNLELERIDYWLSVGAQPSDRVNALVKEFKKAQAGEETIRDKKIKKVEIKKEVAKKTKADEAKKAKAEEAKKAKEAAEAPAVEETPAE
jgi:small subunit ribosomal protein S16